MSKVAVVYWSGTGNTEAMANLIADGIMSAGAEAASFSANDFSAEMVGDFDKIAFGCPSMGVEELEDSEFEPLFTSAEKLLRGKTIALFGSYGWGDGQWMRDWQERCKKAGAEIYTGKGLIVNEAPAGEASEICREFGFGFAKS